MKKIRLDAHRITHALAVRTFETELANRRYRKVERPDVRGAGDDYYMIVDHVNKRYWLCAYPEYAEVNTFNERHDRRARRIAIAILACIIVVKLMYDYPIVRTFVYAIATFMAGAFVIAVLGAFITYVIGRIIR